MKHKIKYGNDYTIMPAEWRMWDLYHSKGYIHCDDCNSRIIGFRGSYKKRGIALCYKCNDGMGILDGFTFLSASISDYDITKVSVA